MSEKQLLDYKDFILSFLLKLESHYQEFMPDWICIYFYAGRKLS